MQGMYSCLIAIHEFAENFLISLHSLFKFSLLWFQFCRPNVIKPHTVRRVTRQTCISIYCQSSCFIVKVVVVAGAAVSGNCCWNTHIVWHNCCKYTKRTQAHMSGMSGSHISVCGSLTFFRGFRSASFFVVVIVAAFVLCWPHDHDLFAALVVYCAACCRSSPLECHCFRCCGFVVAHLLALNFHCCAITFYDLAEATSTAVRTSAPAPAIWRAICSCELWQVAETLTDELVYPTAVASNSNIICDCSIAIPACRNKDRQLLFARRMQYNDFIT